MLCDNKNEIDEYSEGLSVNECLLNENAEKGWM
jgi:hypothetical protein